MQGVNKIFCDAMGLKNTKILIPKQNFIQKLITYTIAENADAIRTAMLQAGAGPDRPVQCCRETDPCHIWQEERAGQRPLV